MIPVVKQTLRVRQHSMTDSCDHADRPSRPLRADARRNRERILESATRACSPAMRPDAQIDDVARRAGVGVGTVYRHFPTRRR